jgi:phosphoribosylformylglycinamidine synthase
VSLIVSAFAQTPDIRAALTPELSGRADTEIVWLRASEHNRLGGSCLAQVFGQLGDETPDVAAETLRTLFLGIQALHRSGGVLAYHDVSDGGLIVTAFEMALCSQQGLTLHLDTLEQAFAEEAGVLVEVTQAGLAQARSLGLQVLQVVARNADKHLRVQTGNTLVIDESLQVLHATWSRLAFEIQRHRDNPFTAEAEYDAVFELGRGLYAETTFDPSEDVAAPFLHLSKPKVAILREQGVNSQIEMAAAFSKAGFTAVDVHMSDLLAGRQQLQQFVGLAACGGFSYGDVLGAGSGWAKTILFNENLRQQFQTFFERSDSFALGVCNGCQMLAQLSSIIPGAEHWPRFTRNASEQYEARLVMVEVQDTPSIFLQGMSGSRIPIVTSHGEGFAEFRDEEQFNAAEKLVSMRFIDGTGQATEQFPLNPNGSPLGITGLTTADGRFNIMMPHPERVHRTVQMSWHPKDWGEDSPWMRVFRNARQWVA